MNSSIDTSSLDSAPKRRHRRAPITVASLVTAGVVLCAALSFTPTVTGSAATATTIPVFHEAANRAYPIGTADSSEPSGEAPPAADAMAGYSQSYLNDFTTSSLPAGWDVFTGLPGGDPGAHFVGSHIAFGAGLLRLNTYKDRSWHDRWVTGGLCQCGLTQTFGAYFVRSRVTGPGPNEAELLWPSGSWPPEIDFSESGGGVASMSSSVHYGASNHIDQRLLRIKLTQWHTWGVIWTPTLITYTVDGQVWGSVSVASEIPRSPMTLDLEQRTKCSLNEQCPTHPVSMLVDWVAEYTPNPPESTTVPAA